MPDREKVIKGLECCMKDDCDNCPYYDPEVDHDCDYFGKCLRGNMYRDALALLKAQEPITGETSDGYHTFNELYHHRAVLFSVIVANYKDRAWKSVRHHDGTMYNGMFIVGIDTPDGQATYHYDINPYWDMFDCKVREFAPKWDGHTPAQAIERIGKLKAQEPRLMTLEEVVTRRGEPVWFESKSGRTYNGYVLIYDVREGIGITGVRVGITQPGYITIWPSKDLYGVKWRCWTSRPSDEQREAAPWN